MGAELDTVQGIDPRLTLLSYSGLLSLHSCPRRYQLDKMNEKIVDTTATDENITFTYGHAVGEGVQEFFANKTYEQAVWKMYCKWAVDLFAANDKKGKSFWLAVSAIRKLYAIAEMFSQYEIVHYVDVDGNSKPAVELGFIIECPDGFKFRGFVDVVLKNKDTGEIIVVEVKTTGNRNLHPAQYKNSAQALGYSVVLDSIVPSYSSYKVIYLVYCTTEEEWEQMSFNKTLLQRARWIQQLMLDIEVIKMYAANNYFPQHGESCYDYYRECKYFGNCGLDTKYVTQPLTQAVVTQLRTAQKQFSIKLNIQDLIQSQLSKQ